MSVTSKLGNAHLLLQNKVVSPHIPMILPATPKTLKKMLQHFSSVYMKPNSSCQGKGILRVDPDHDRNQFLLRTRDTGSTSVHYSLHDLWSQIHQVKQRRYCIIQQGINSVTINQHPFYIRVHLTRINGKWGVSGIVGRVAQQKDKIVTNAYSGGVSININNPLTEQLEYTPKHVQITVQKLKNISMHATKTISKIYPKWSEFGLDIGIDQNAKPWIYEINIFPGTLVFKNLDKSIYHRILYLRKWAS